MSEQPELARGGHGELGDEFVSRLSHALRTPVALIIGYAELLRTRDDEEIRREAPVLIREAAQELTDAIDDLVVVVAVDAGVLLVRPAALELEPVLTDTIRRVEKGLDGLRLSVECASWPVVAADDDHLPRILHNLLVNAGRRSPEGGEIRLSIRAADGFATVAVTDAGLPLTDEQARRAFERFSTPEWSTREKRTTGLELYKARRLVELHGGATSAWNEGNGGATFAFTIPLAATEKLG